MHNDHFSLKELIIASTLYTSYAIAGPLFIFGGLGFALDSYWQTKPWVTLGGVGIAFVATNIILFRKLKEINAMINAQATPQPRSQNKRDTVL